MEDLTQTEVNEFWEEGFRPYEIYVCNDEPVMYNGVVREAGTIEGWDIKHIFTKIQWLDDYPFLDTVIMTSCVQDCEEMFIPLSQLYNKGSNV